MRACNHGKFKPNIILIVIDTLRKDHSKTLENKLTKEGFKSYDNTYSASPWTVPSHASLFSGLYSISHKTHVTKNKSMLDYRIKPDIQPYMIQNILKKHGYNNYLISANQHISPFFGYQNFDYTENIDRSSPPIYKISRKEQLKINKLRTSKQKNIKANIKLSLKLLLKKEFKLSIKFYFAHLTRINWKYNILFKYIYNKILDWPKNKGSSNIIKRIKSLLISEPAFIFINFMEIHQPYTPENNFLKDIENNIKHNIRISKENINFYRVKYNEFCDYVFNKIIELIMILKEKRLFENSLVIITSDHGQLIGEYGRLGHRIFLYEELLSVPLFIRYPKNIDLNIYHNNHNKFISLKNLKSFILNIIQNNRYNENHLYSETIFSESYGTRANINTWKQNEIKYVKELDKYRIKILHRDYSGILNVSKWMFEEKYMDKDKIRLNENQIDVLKKEIITFLKAL